ncbi:alpha/beta hydrolase [Herbiconiux sp. YIM B11900]|uniref:alpha/beta hydrolase n=1 Tax=Herbiconiux sp. YIM B11900 TaxID=3404131 RepID=UPI003F841003
MSETDAAPLTIDDEAVVWSVPRDRIAESLATQPLVIVMHGRGSHEADLPSLFPFLPEGIVFASLRAPLSGAPFGMGGWTWFPLAAAPDGTGSPAGADVVAAADAVLAWLDRTEAQHGTPPAVVGLGFSQGGMMSIELMRSAPHRFAAAVDLSGVSAIRTVDGDEVLAERRPPLFWGRDAADPIIPLAGVERTAAFAPRHFTVTERLYPGIAHSISREELGDVSAFLRAALALDDEPTAQPA